MKVRSKLMKKVIAAAVVFLMAGLGKFALSKVTTNDDDKNSVASCISCFLYNSGCQESDSGNGVNTNIVPSRGQVQDSTSSNSSTVTSSNDASSASNSQSNSSTVTSSNDASSASNSNSNTPSTCIQAYNTITQNERIPSDEFRNRLYAYTQNNPNCTYDTLKSYYDTLISTW